MGLLKFRKEKKEIQRGKFIVIDGTDGSGKGTQTKLLIETLKTEGYAVEMADFPRYGQRSAAMVEDYLNGKYGQVNPKASSIFYAIDRFDAATQVRDWLSEGKVVVSNRYVTASAGHQGGKIDDELERGKFFRWLNNLEYEIFGIPRPDLNLILHVPAETAQLLVDKKSADERKYANGKKRDLHEADLNHLKNAEKVFLEIAKLFPNTKLVECVHQGILLSPEQVHNKIWDLVRRIALKDVKPTIITK